MGKGHKERKAADLKARSETLDRVRHNESINPSMLFSAHKEVKQTATKMSFVY